MLLDTASLYFRAFFGVPDTVARAGRNARSTRSRGLLDFIARLVSTYQPTDLVCCWDDDWRPQWRVDLHPDVQGAPGRAGGRDGGVDVEDDARTPLTGRSR